MIEVTHLHRNDQSPVDDWLDLPYEFRCRSRFRFIARSGADIGVFLERGLVLDEGDVLIADDGKRFGIKAANETVVTAYAVGGKRISEMPESLAELNEARPVLESFAGWNAPTGAARHWDDLPREARRYLDRLEERAGVPIRLVSVGSGRDENVRRHANLRSTEAVGL